jgi:hypothetical protein
MKNLHKQYLFVFGVVGIMVIGSIFYPAGYTQMLSIFGAFSIGRWLHIYAMKRWPE